MRRTVRDRTEARPKPVQKIELSGKRLGWRLLAVILLLAFGAASIGYGVMNLFSPGEKGWIEITANEGSLNCAGDFTFFYEVGASGRSASSERKALTALYTDLAEKAWQLFSNLEGTAGLRYLNDHPGEAVEVDPALYRAFEQIEASGSRVLYLGPVEEVYNGLFSCQEDVFAAEFDPLLSDSLRAFFLEAAGYARDPEAMNVALLGDNTVRLDVSEACMAWAREEEVGNFLDFCWMRNAFVIDYLADGLAGQGYTLGALSSYDGFVRVLDSRERSGYAYNLYDRGEPAGVMRYSGTKSIVTLRSYPLSALDSERFYVRQDGQIRTAYLDPADGLTRAAANDLTAYSDAMGCAELLLRLAPVYLADSLDPTALEALAGEGLHSVWMENGQMVSTDPELTVSVAEEP